MRYIFTLFVFLLSGLLSEAQTFNNDSLLNLIDTTDNEMIKVDAYIELAEYHKESDTALFFKYNREALKLSDEIDYSQGRANVFINYGLFYTVKTNYDTAVVFFDKAAKICEKFKLKRSQVAALGNAGNVYCYKGDYSQGLNNFLKALDIMYELDNQEWVATATNNIGSVYYLLGEYDNALKYYSEALAAYSKIDNKEGVALATSNIGIIYFERDDLEKALEYYLEAEKLRETLPNKQQLANVYSNIGTVYSKLGDIRKAVEYFNKGIVLSQEIGDMHHLANTYLSLSDYYTELKRYIPARDYVNSAFEVSESNDLLRVQLQCYYKYAELDSISGNYPAALSHYKKAIEVKDSIFSQENTENINELQTKYETEKKEKENQILKQQKMLDDKKIEKQHIINIAFFVGALLLLFAALVALYSGAKIRKAHKALQNLHAQVNQQNEEIQTQAEHLQSANTEILKNKQIIELSHSQITASINYAGRIQTAALPNTDMLDTYFGGHFIYYQPRDIVSGDFYWVKKIKDHILIAVADCTGHGVPGAFVSMLGISLLNDIVSHSAITQTNQVLDELRNRVKASLNQQGGRFEQKDGMDISLCAINTKTLTMQFSGAHNPVYVIRQSQKLVNLTKLKADRMPIGIHRKEVPFTEQTFQLKKNDMIYLFTDGYIDQFGGRNDDKFKSKRFQTQLISQNQNSILTQRQNLKESFVKWKGQTDQLDDVLILGVRI